ncbi:MAG: fumarate hydratase [Clostridiales Family XIII bacterium]|jgi:fumarate hydratase subunit alpha|nr:fumarate hydratase [Clostridiales Family XIII bacterium]
MKYDDIVRKTADTLLRAASSFRADQIKAYECAVFEEEVSQSKWVMENILENAFVAESGCSPLCDDTGIPHVILEVGKSQAISREVLKAIGEGIEIGLRELPGRPMAIMGNDEQRLDQSGGLNPDSGAMLPAPIMLLHTDEDVLRLHVLMQGGGPEIRSKTYRVFHKHSVEVLVDEIVSWASEVVGQLGCTPSTLAVGIGRSHYEASSLMLQAMTFGNYSEQNALEKEISSRVNKTNVGPLGLGGKNTVLATFMKVGPQRASGVRIVCLRPCCCFEPRVASIEL